MKLDKATAGLVLLALALLIAGALGVYALTPVGERPALLHTLSGPLGQFSALLLAAAGAWVTAYRAKATHAETSAQTPIIEQIQHQTNGNLDKRLAAQTDENERRTRELLREYLGAGAPAASEDAGALASVPTGTDVPEVG